MNDQPIDIFQISHYYMPPKSLRRRKSRRYHGQSRKKRGGHPTHLGNNNNQHILPIFSINHMINVYDYSISSHDRKLGYIAHKPRKTPPTINFTSYVKNLASSVSITESHSLCHLSAVQLAYTLTHYIYHNYELGGQLLAQCVNKLHNQITYMIQQNDEPSAINAAIAMYCRINFLLYMYLSFKYWPSYYVLTDIRVIVEPGSPFRTTNEYGDWRFLILIKVADPIDPSIPPTEFIHATIGHYSDIPIRTILELAQHFIYDQSPIVNTVVFKPTTDPDYTNAADLEHFFRGAIEAVKYDVHTEESCMSLDELGPHLTRCLANQNPKNGCTMRDGLFQIKRCILERMSSMLYSIYHVSKHYPPTVQVPSFITPTMNSHINEINLMLVLFYHYHELSKLPWNILTQATIEQQHGVPLQDDSLLFGIRRYVILLPSDVSDYLAAETTAILYPLAPKLPSTPPEHHSSPPITTHSISNLHI